LALDKGTNTYRMHKNRFSFISELERDTANIDDIRIAGQKLAAVYSNEEDLV